MTERFVQLKTFSLIFSIDEEEAEATEEQAQQAPSQAAVSELLQEAATDSPRLTARSDDLMTDDTTSAGRDERCVMIVNVDSMYYRYIYALLFHLDTLDNETFVSNRTLLGKISVNSVLN